MVVRYSIVLPAHNEVENLPQLLKEISSVMTDLTESWEVVVVDDASTDGTWNALKKFEGPLQAIRLKHQSGQSAALNVGLKAAKGEILITLDADGQNDPHDIPLLLKALEGEDCVSGWRQHRHDRFHRRLISSFANGTRRWVLGDSIQDTGCSLKAFRANCFHSIKLFKGMHRFLPSLFLIEGFRVKEIPVSHRPRARGTSNYSIFNRGVSTVSDLFAVWWMKRRRLFAPIAEQFSTNRTS
jgi:glycosyltransferase involved in cell wall biosynthesis